MLKNTTDNYGLVSKTFHWLSAIIIIGLFILGIWMVDLTYYSEWYKTAPHWHKSIGILLFIFTALRLLWKVINPKPLAEKSQTPLVQKSSHIAHLALYLILLVIMSSGYLISTADNRAIDVFDWFSIPSLGQLFDQQEDIAGEIHQYSAYILIALSALHAIAALKHHFIDKDRTLTKMIK